MSKKAITIRVDAALLAAVRQCATDENRTLTNYIETVLKYAVAPVHAAAPVDAVALKPSELAAVPILLSGDGSSDASLIEAVEPAGEA